jgi:lipid A 3-O-deacylase
MLVRWHGGLCLLLIALAMTVSPVSATGLSAATSSIRGVEAVEPDFPAIDELRLGILESVDGPKDDKGGSPDVNLELLLGRFGPAYQSAFWNHFLRPRPTLGTSINTGGGTDEFYGGFTWDAFLTRRLFVEAFAGGALHDGDDDYFGCRANFREAGSVGIMLSAHWDLLATVDHMSNANLCDENRGLTNIGIRLGRKW